MDLAGRVAIVTGGGTGIGRATCMRLATAGAKAVVINYSRSADDAESTAEEVRRLGSEAVPHHANIADEEMVKAMVASTVERYARLDVLVNNAGTTHFIPHPDLEALTDEVWNDILSVNLKGTFFASQAAGRVMIRQQHGRIINMSSQAGFAALPGESVYCMTKAAIAHLTKCLAVEWGRHGITVNAVAPTFIRTPGTEEYLSVPQNRADVLERIAALHRIGEPMEVAGAVVFLASPAASLITGETILIDGGWTAR